MHSELEPTPSPLCPLCPSLLILFFPRFTYDRRHEIIENGTVFMTSQVGKKWWQNSDSSDSDWGFFAISSNTNKAYQWIVSASWVCHTRMLPKGFHHLEQSTRWYKVHLKNKIILKSVILLSDIEYFKRPRVSHLLKEFGRLSGCSRDFSSSHVLAKWIHITIGIELVVYVRCVKKKLSTDLPPRPSPCFPVVSEQSIYECIRCWVNLSICWILQIALKSSKYLLQIFATFPEISSSRFADVRAKGTSCLSNAAWLCCLGEQKHAETVVARRNPINLGSANT